jgi:hypothetical protein
MNSRIQKLTKIFYPQNYIIRHPLAGTIIVSLFTFTFTILYKPLGFHPAKTLSYALTMAVYSFLPGASIIISVKLIKTLRYFSDSKEWTILKEVVSVFLILSGIGITVYFLGFFIETSGNRWTISTFLDSYKYSLIIGIFPFAFFMALNYRYLLSGGHKNHEAMSRAVVMENQTNEEPVQINSRLKKEELSFYPGEFLYAESDGNYVVFYLFRNNQIKKEVIRNSINNIEQQMSAFPYFMRTHRAFIVNLKKIRSKQGNSLGYLIKLIDTEFRIPVSRNRIELFNKLFPKYQNK